jgi:hypothetical protein
LSSRIRTMRLTSLKNVNIAKQCEKMYKNSTVFEIKKEIAESRNSFYYMNQYYFKQFF